ncbi:hypothetical protein [Streptomyces sp. NPDC059708]|uniref:hypothetical protein n=1 Tax=Streptomyces sp. NPDC059708 TaxID=3346916 RepID=UPI0036CFA7AE
MSRRTSLVLTSAGVIAAGALAAVVALPAAADWYEHRHEQSDDYATGAEAKKDRASVPRWLADDAASVRYAMKTTGGERLLKADLPGGRLPAGCEPAAPAGAKPPQITAECFPEGAESKAAARCGLYYAYMDGTTLYAWQHNDDWIKDGART